MWMFVIEGVGQSFHESVSMFLVDEMGQGMKIPNPVCIWMFVNEEMWVKVVHVFSSLIRKMKSHRIGQDRKHVI